MDCVPHLRLDLPAVSGNVPLIRHAVVAFAASQGADEELQGEIALAVTEAVANAVVHAYRDRELPATVTVEADADPTEGDLQIVVLDEGLGVSTRYDSDGLGMGLGIIAGLAHDFSVRDRHPRGTEVFMRFHLDGDPVDR